MNLSLTPVLEQFIRDKVASGEYNNASEVVREAIRLLKDKDEQRQLKLERLKTAIKEGDDAIRRGDYIEINTKQEMDDFFASL